MGTGLAAEIVQALLEQAVIVPGTQAATIVMPRVAQQLGAFYTSSATKSPPKLNGWCLLTLFGRS